MKYKYVFIDLDDTLWDFRSNANESLNEVFTYFSLDKYFPDFETFFDLYINKNNELWRLYEQGSITKEYLRVERFRYPLSKVNIQNNKLAEEMNNRFMQLLPTRTNLVPFAKELLEYLSQKYPLTIISNGFEEVQYSKLNNSGIQHYFQYIVLSESAKALKPDKAIFEYALKLNNAEPFEAIMIGDVYHADIVGAANAGIHQIYLNRRNVDLKENESSTYQVNSLEKILDIL